jgi:hypothetical protein
MTNPSEGIIDMRRVFEKGTLLEIEGFRCWKVTHENPQNHPLITCEDEVSYNLSTFTSQGQKCFPLIYSVTQNRITKLWGTEVHKYPVIKPLLLKMRQKEVVFVELPPECHRDGNRKDDIYLRVEVVNVKKGCLPYNMMTLERKIQSLKERKVSADELNRDKKYADAAKKYEIIFVDFKGLPKKERKVADQDLMTQYDDIGLRTLKNLIRCYHNTKDFERAHEIIKYIDNHINDKDWVVIDLTLQVYMSQKNQKEVKIRLEQLKDVDKSEYLNWDARQYQKWVDEINGVVVEDRKDKKLGKALLASLTNAKIEEKRERLFGELDEQGQRMLLSMVSGTPAFL